MPGRRAFAADKVTLRTNWLFYGSHAIFFLGSTRASTTRTTSTSWSSRGNGSGNTVRLVANKDSTFAYVSASALIKLAAQGAPIISVATIDATGTEAVLVHPDSGIKTFKDLEGKKVLTTAGAGVNTFFPSPPPMPASTSTQVELVNVAESALVQELPAEAGGRPCSAASTRQAGRDRGQWRQDADHLQLCGFRVYQPGYAIVTHKDLVKDNPTLVRRFVAGTLAAVQAAKDNPDDAGQVADQLEGQHRDERRSSRPARCSTSPCRS